MKTNQPLHINIPKPCKQDWAVMQKAGDGKFCSSCSNVVYDFSGMNDDELLDFFKKNPNTHCGRFHNSQLKRDILPAKKKRILFINRFNKIAAAVFAVLSFRSISLQAESRNVKPALALDPHYKKNALKTEGKIIITGRIRDGEDKLLEGAKVMFDSVQVATTGKDGKFSFEPGFVTPGDHNFYFSYDGLITVVRTYHSVMQSTDYDIILYKQGVNVSSYTGGIMVLPGIAHCANFDLFFKPNLSKLSLEVKSILDNFAITLKNHPEALIDIKANCISLGKNYMLVKKRAEAVKEYLVERNGISPERLFIKIVRSGDDTNTINMLDRIDEQ